MNRFAFRFKNALQEKAQSCAFAKGRVFSGSRIRYTCTRASSCWEFVSDNTVCYRFLYTVFRLNIVHEGLGTARTFMKLFAMVVREMALASNRDTLRELRCRTEHPEQMTRTFLWRIIMYHLKLDRQLNHRLPTPERVTSDIKAVRIANQIALSVDYRCWPVWQLSRIEFVGSLLGTTEVDFVQTLCTQLRGNTVPGVHCVQLRSQNYIYRANYS